MHAKLTFAFLCLSFTTVAAQELRQIDVPGWASACYDPIRERVVAQTIGGYSSEWDGAVWRQAPDAGAPRGFCYVDVSTSRLCVVTRTFVATGMRLDMWERQGSDWQIVPSPGAPPLRNEMTLCYDSVRDELVAFGGFSPITSAPLGDTWVWDDSGWTQRAVSGPPPRARSTVAFDHVRQRVVMFGGYASPANYLNDTWEWDGAAWSSVATPTSPPPSVRGNAVYDPSRQRVVMVCLVDTAGFPVEHWEYDGATWNAPSAPLPTTHHTPVVAHDTARAETLLLGGFDVGGQHGEVWAWNGTAWSQRPGFGYVPVQSFGTEVAADPFAVDIQLFGPTSSSPVPGNIDELWTFDGATWTWTLTATGGPPGRQDPLFWRMQGASYVLGGWVGQALTNDLWRWDGLTWTQLSPAGASPSPRSRASCAVDLLRDRVVIFGGQDGTISSNQTWVFDGVAWSQSLAGLPPPKRYWSAMAYDPLRDVVVLYGGIGGPSGSTPLSDTWEWDGVVWRQIATGLSPPRGGRMTYDFTSQRILHFVPDGGSRDYEIWSFDGATWTQVNMLGTAGSSNALRASLPRPVTTANGVFVADQYSGMHALLLSPARTEHYGSSCGVDVPELAAAGLPRVADATFALDVVNAPANAPVRIAAAETSATVPILGCSLLVAPSIATLFGSASATGHAEFSVAIPNAPALSGVSVYFQAATLAPSSANGFALSKGLRVVVGQ